MDLAPGTPFRRARIMFAALASISALSQVAQISAMRNLGEYKGRGKGLGRHSGAKKGNNHSSRYAVQALTGNQPREVARRKRQIESGALQCN